MSIRISIFYILPVVLLIFIPSLFCQTNSIDSLIGIYKSDEQNPTNIIKIGEAYAAEKRWDLAINYYEKLIRIDPNNSDYLYRLGGTQAAYSEVVSKFKVLPLINTAKRNLIKSASLNKKHIYSRWALVQILTELPQILGGNKDDAQDYCHEILNISKVHGLLSYHYYHSFQSNEKKIIEFEKKIIDSLNSNPVLFDFNYFNFVIGKILTNQNHKKYNNLSIKYLERYISQYSSADRFSLDETYYLLAYSNFKLGNDNSRHFIKLSKEVSMNSEKRNYSLIKKIDELNKLINR